jgi:hypothetical protein
VTDEEIAARVEALRDELQNGNAAPKNEKAPPRPPDVPTPIPTKP